ncbi:claspin-like [Hydractinia symbiolongicarpus]|uniref:claspin-like n=1 Tax=Hydractinia symbiolongicarpus TaxID=13093 RepID=UPI00254E58E5|nr:claspin-like [Hydractinia symbiolongicarpus]
MTSETPGVDNSIEVILTERTTCIQEDSSKSNNKKFAEQGLDNKDKVSDHTEFTEEYEVRENRTCVNKSQLQSPNTSPKNITSSSKKKRKAVIDSSDSESDADSCNVNNNIKKNDVPYEKKGNSETEEGLSTNRIKKNFFIDSSDSESESGNVSNNIKKRDVSDEIKSKNKAEEKLTTSRIKKNCLIGSSDSESDDDISHKKEVKSFIGENRHDSGDDVTRILKNKLGDNADNENDKSKSPKNKFKKKRPILDSSDNNSDSDEDDSVKKSTEEKDKRDSSGESGSDSGCDDHVTTESEKKEKERPKRFSKTMAMQTTSEQQRLKREQTINLPCHTPTTKPLTEFLKRVPQLKKNTPDWKRKEKTTSKQLPKSEERKSNFQKLFEHKPRLSLPGNEIEFNIEGTEKSQQRSKGLDSLMKRFAKHTNVKKHNNKKSVTIEDPDVTNSGGSRAIILEKLKSEMRKKRQENHLEMERQVKFYEEESYMEDAEDQSDEENSDADSNNENGEENNDSEVEHAEANDDTNKDHGENKKEDEKMKKDDAKLARPFNRDNDTSPVFEVPQLLQNENNVEKDENLNWEDSSSTMSSILHPGQGDPTGRRIENSDGRLTPFSKLLKSGLLDSASKSHQEQSNEIPSLSLPCENTQDLFMESKEEKEDYEDEPDISQHFHLALDEDTQFGQVLDSQGFIHDNKSKKKPQKKLFDDGELKMDSQFSMTQVLGFCSGQFTAKEDEKMESDDKKDVLEGEETKFYDQEQDEKESRNDEKRSIEDIFPRLLENSVATGNKNDNEDDTGSEKGDEEDAVEEGDDVEDNVEESGNESEDADDEEEEGVENRTEENKDEEQNDNEEFECEEVDDAVKKGKTWQKKLFYEEEAELSGSDIGSEDEELGSEYDEYEVDSDAENIPTTEKLKKQVHRIHQRKMMDQDKREVRLLQELYFEDGDLGEGNRRKRNFRWRNSDVGFGKDGEHKLSDEENEEPLTEIDIKQRMERIERENFIQQQEHSQKVEVLDECSQMILEKIISEDKPSTPSFVEPRKKNRSLSNTKPQGIKRSGSFIGSHKASQEVILNTGAIINTKPGKSFVFQTAEALKTQSKSRKNKVADDESFVEPPRKITKLSQHELPKRSKSIFKLM